MKHKPTCICNANSTYNIRIKNLSFKETKRPVPKQHKLRENQTLDQISSDAAKYYHKQGDKKMMSQFLNCMEDITLRVDFLMDRFNENNDYIHIAADLYRKEGKLNYNQCLISILLSQFHVTKNAPNLYYLIIM